MATKSTAVRTVVGASRAAASKVLDFHAVPHRMLEVGASRIAYRTLGEGPDLVFIHGWPLDLNTYRDLAPLLASSFRCHLFDLPGAGATQTTDRRALRLDAHIDTTRALIDQLGLQRYAILAHDSGGLIARYVAADDARVTALVLGNTEISGHHAPMLQVLKAVVNTPVLGPLFLSAVMRMPFVRRSRVGFGGCFENRDLIDGEFNDLFLAPMLADKRRAFSQTELLRTLDPALVDRLPDVHARLRCPVQLIWGRDDPFFPLPLARKMLPEFAAGATLEVIEDGKLYVHEERPAPFAHLARSFLQEAFAASDAQAPGGEAATSRATGAVSG